MPELPDITVYIEALESRIVGQTLDRTRISKPFLLRSVDPPISAAHGKRVGGFRRMGKRIVIELEDDLFLVIHLMIAGRLRWVPAGGKVPGKIGLAAFDFTNGTLILTEARRSRTLPPTEAGLAALDRRAHLELNHQRSRQVGKWRSLHRSVEHLVLCDRDREWINARDLVLISRGLSRHSTGR